MESYLQKNMVIKRFHLALTIFLLLIVLAWSFPSIFRFIFFNSPTLYNEKEITKDIYLYVTEDIRADFSPDIYTYYLSKKINGDLLPKLKRKRPLMVANSGNADISLDKNIHSATPHIIVKYTGEIFKFNNNPHSINSKIKIDASSDDYSRKY